VSTLRSTGNRCFEPEGWHPMRSIAINRRDIVRALGISIVTGRAVGYIRLLDNTRLTLASARVNFMTNRQGSYTAADVELVIVSRGGSAEWCDVQLQSRVWGYQLAEPFQLAHSLLRAGDVIQWGDFVINVEE